MMFLPLKNFKENSYNNIVGISKTRDLVVDLLDLIKVIENGGDKLLQIISFYSDFLEYYIKVILRWIV